jgi:hypothetical protein
VLENYFQYLNKNDQSYLSRFYGVYQIKIPNMMTITCCIMNNLVGIDFIDTIRMYDLKGSTFGRRTKISQKEIEG